MKEFTIPELEQKIAKIAIDRAVYTALAEIAPAMEEECKVNAINQISPDGTPYAPSKHPRKWGSGGPLNDTGKMIAGIEASVPAATELNLTSDSPQSRLMQDGGTIVPVNAKFLTIPLTEEAARAGGARNYPGELTAIVNEAGTKGVLRDEDGEAVYALTVGPVEVPARPFVGFSEEMLQSVEDAIAEKVMDAIVEALTR